MKKILTVLALAALSGSVFAATYPLYGQPNDKAKVIGKINDQTPDRHFQFYRQGDWVKIADTQNGNVGWVKLAPTMQTGNVKSPMQKYQAAYNQIQADQVALQAKRQQFEQNYQHAVYDLQQRMQNLQQQIRQENQKTIQTVNTTNKNNQKLNPSRDNQVEQSFHAITVKTDQGGKTATVTKSWLAKDGKMHKTTQQVPVSELQSMSFTM